MASLGDPLCRGGESPTLGEIPGQFTKSLEIEILRWKKKEEEKMQVKKEKEEKKRGKKRTPTHVQSQDVPVNSRREPGDPKGRGASPPSWVEYPANLQNLWRLILTPHIQSQGVPVNSRSEPWGSQRPGGESPTLGEIPGQLVYPTL